MSTFVEWTYEDEEGAEVLYRFPARWVVCWRCRGNGSHTNPNIDGNGLTEEDLREWSHDEREGYFSGAYDVQCHECHGRRVLPEIKEESIERSGDEELKKGYKLYLDHLDDQANYRALVEAERRRGC